jgi:CelD/BcsL family acetyltransferase involved in cellulose biosynthesis
MTVEIHLAHNEAEWDTIIAKSPHGTLFHSWNWLKITEKHTRMKLFPLIGKKGNTTIGAFPLFFQKTGPIRMVFSPPPHASVFYLGPVLIGCNPLLQEKWESIYTDFQFSMENYITKNFNPNYTYFALSPHLQDPRPFSWSGYTINPNYDYTIDLSKGIDDLFQSLDRKQRVALRKAKEKGMQFEIGGKEEFEKVLDLMEIRYAEQGKILNTQRQFFLDLYDSYKDILKIFVVKIDNEIVTGSIRLDYRDTLFGWFGNSRPKNRISPSPNHFLFWETIQYASEHGYKYYTTMGAAGNKRMHEFYAARFNPELKIRYTASKTTHLTRVFEGGYKNIIKPLRGTIKHLEQME